jgi:hypothetical protein
MLLANGRNCADRHAPWFLVMRLSFDDGIAGWPGLGPAHGQGRLQLAR